MGILDKAKQIAAIKSEFGPMAALFTFFQGRSTFFAICFLIDGLILSALAVYGILKGKDISQIAPIITSLGVFMGSLQALLFAHSCKEDWTEIQHRKLDIQQQQLSVTVNNVPPPVK